MIRHRVAEGDVGRKNSRTCLLDAIKQILPPNIDVEGLSSMIEAQMPKEGDTSIMDIKCALLEHSLILEVVNKKYIKRGGAAFYLFMETSCRLIVRLRLINVEQEIMYHFVAWDGKTVYDSPNDIVIDREKDLTSGQASKMAFDKLYPNTEFFSWQITAVYRLLQTVP